MYGNIGEDLVTVEDLHCTLKHVSEGSLQARKAFATLRCVYNNLTYGDHCGLVAAPDRAPVLERAINSIPIAIPFKVIPVSGNR